jgi:splicing factor 3B subunit 2
MSLVAIDQTNDISKQKIPEPGQEQPNGNPSRKQKIKQKRAERKKKKALLKEKLQNLSDSTEDSKTNDTNVEVEYVVANPLDELETADPIFKEFAEIFSKFSNEDLVKKKQQEQEQLEGEKKEKEKNEMAQQEKSEESSVTSKDQKTSNEDEKSKDEKSKDETSKSETKKLSKRQKRIARRINIAVLKQLVKRPDLVEIHDTCAADPFFLLHLKSYRNTVPVPRHWSQKRKYLQNKRGIEKPPFELPDFIKATGIMEIRQASLQKAEEKTLKQKQRERMQPKMGKIDIDYQVLHDAFVRYQTKPKMTGFGDLYYEGKEFEVKLKQKRPGVLSDELKQALGMKEGYAPPWIFNMQRYGPPPSYPKLRIPGVNAPIPPGASWGYHPGGWGRPPVDEWGRPLWGGDLGQTPNAESGKQAAVAEQAQQPPPNRQKWGVLLPEEVAPPPQEKPPAEEEKAQAVSAEVPLEEEQVASGIESVPGIETPDQIELRKFSAQSTEEKKLYQILPQKQATVGSSLMGSAYTYELNKGEEKQKVDLIKSKKTEEIDIALDPSELELPESEIQKKFQQVLEEREKAKQAAQRVTEPEDSHKRKAEPKESKKAKKTKRIQILTL